MQRGLLFIGVLAVAGLVLMLHVSALSSSTEISGKIFGSDGRQLYPTDGLSYWLGSNGEVFDISLLDSYHIIAMTGAGQVVGTGTINDLEYKITLFGGWEQEPRLAVYAGFYDPVRPDRTHLLYCTSFEPLRVPVARRVLVDLTCEHIALVEGTRAAYR